MIRSAVACNLDIPLLQSCLPLFDSGKVEALEWSFDVFPSEKQLPEWFDDLLSEFSKNNALIGHGVFFSIFSGRWTSNHQNWIAQLRQVSKRYQFDHVTEHFGFMTGTNFHAGAPIGIPLTQSTLALGQDRLKRIQQAGNCPVGLENLALSYSLEEVKRHGEFLLKLIEPVNGFIILDLHNLYCQMHNFNILFEEIISHYPLGHVREIHISGGSWEKLESKPEIAIRRDTHDEQVPKEVFDLLTKVISICPNLKYVVLEQIGASLNNVESQIHFQEDFYKLEQIVSQKSNTYLPSVLPCFLPTGLSSTYTNPLQDLVLAGQQAELSAILEDASNLADAQKLLSTSGLAQSCWQVEKWDPCMLETAMKIAQKWKSGRS